MNQTNDNMLSYDGKTSRLYAIWFRNFLLQIITFGIYRAWAKTNMRRYLWTAYKIDGDRLEYTGKGGELFRGYMKMYLIIFLISFTGLIISMILGDIEKPGEPKRFHFSDLLLWLFIIYLIYFGKFSALRYRLTRTRWRGIRGTLKGSGRSYVWFRVKRAFLDVITLGFANGRTGMLDNRYLVERMYFGSQHCTYTGEKTELDKINMITILLFIPTLGFSRMWFCAALLNAKYNHLQAGTVNFKASFTGGKLLGLAIGNFFIMIFTLFLGMPIVMQRIMKCFSANVQVLGSVEGSAIMQASDNAGNLGEGVEDYLSYDGIDFDMGVF